MSGLGYVWLGIGTVRVRVSTRVKVRAMVRARVRMRVSVRARVKARVKGASNWGPEATAGAAGCGGIRGHRLA